MPRGLAALALTALAALAGCLQPVGGRCQTNDDCASGVCSIAEPRTCREGGGEVVVTDARPPDAKVDARLPVDAGPIDADMTGDLPDAGLGELEPDADVPDADLPDAQ